MTLEVDKEGDLNWAFIDNLLLTNPDPLSIDYIDEDIPNIPDFTFIAEEVAKSNTWWEANPDALNFDKDIYDA
jgi:hypothetical protein